MPGARAPVAQSTTVKRPRVDSGETIASENFGPYHQVALAQTKQRPPRLWKDAVLVGDARVPLEG